MKPGEGDFASIMEGANKMANAPIAHPFGAPKNGGLGRNQGLPIRQTTEVFYLPKQAAEYDACCNRAWSGEVSIRYEERTWTKESEMAIAVCYFERAAPERPHEVPANGDAEPEEKPRKLP